MTLVSVLKAFFESEERDFAGTRHSDKFSRADSSAVLKRVDQAVVESGTTLAALCKSRDRHMTAYTEEAMNEMDLELWPVL